MPLDDAKSIRKHFDGLKGERGTWESLWQEVSDHGLGRRSFTGMPYTPGGRGKRTRNIYDNTMMVANEMLAAGLHNILTPTATRWVHVEPADPRVLQLEGAADWYADAEEILVREVERYESGFHVQVAGTYADISAFGNGGLSTLWDSAFGLVFQGAPLSETYVEEDSYGRVNRIYRDLQLTAAQIIEKFGPDKAPERVRADYEKGNLDNRHGVLQALIPNPAYTPHTRFGVGAHAITSWYIDEKGGLIDKETFREMPTAFARVDKDSDESYGRGRGVQAISDQRMLNKMSWTTLRAAEKAIDPPMLVPDNGYITQLDLSPGGHTVYRATTPEGIRELYTRPGQNVDLGVQLLQQRQTNIRAAYHYELLQLIQDPRMSATQVLEISARVQQILSPMAAVLQSELLQPTVTRAFMTLLRNRRFPPTPIALAAGGVRFRYVSPVQRAQRAAEARNALDALNAAIQLAQIDPRALDPVDSEQMTRFFFQAFGVAPNLMRTPQAVQKLQQGRAALQEQREMRETAMQAAEGAGKLAPIVTALSGARAA